MSGRRKAPVLHSEKQAIERAWAAMEDRAATNRYRLEWVEDLADEFKVVFGPGPKHPVLKTGITPGLWRVYVNKRSGECRVDLPL